MARWLPVIPLALRRAGTIAIAAVIVPCSFGLEPSRSVFQYRSESWSRQNGLPVNAVNAIAQSKDGYLWFGTQQGLVRFDGDEFTTIPVPRTPIFVSQNIYSLAPAKNGGVWFGLREGSVGHYDGKSFSPLPAPWVEPNMQVFGVRELQDGSVWVAWNFGYGRWRPGMAPIAGSEASVGQVCYHGLYEDPSGRVWLSAVDPGAVYYWSGGERHVFADDALRKLNVNAFAQDRDGRIWMGSQLGIRCYDAQFRLQPLPAEAPMSQINALLVDSHGVLWIGTEGEGLVRCRGGEFVRFDTRHGLVNDYVSALCEDTEGNLWIGTRGGVTELSDVKFPLYGEPDGLVGEPLAVANAADGGIWVATARGISHIANEKITTLNPDPPAENLYVKRVWEAANGDLYSIDGSRGLTIYAGSKVVGHRVLKEWPIAFANDRDGLVVSFGPELYRVSRDRVTPFVYKSGIPPAMVWVVNLWPARDGSLWVASHRGVWRVKDGEYRQWSTQNGLSGSVANWVFEDSDGTVWAGLASGLARIRDGQVRCLGAADGLFDNFIYAIVPDDFGWFWIDSSAGIFRVSRSNLNDVADGRATQLHCEPFNGQDAVSSNDKHAQEPTFARTKDGRIWFPTAAGVVAIDPAHVPSNHVPPRVYILRTRVNGMSWSEPNRRNVAPGRGDLDFRYTGIGFTAPEKIRFRYLLEGYDEHWVDAEDRRDAFYTNLKPGEYTFRVIAVNGDGVWNRTGDSITVTLPPHFYQTRWFGAFCLLGTGGLIFGGYAWRVKAIRGRQRQLQDMNALLDAKVQSRTAELAQANQQLAATNQQLAAANSQLVDEISERKRFELEAEKVNQQLLVASREAGMAEVATSVLHNVGNVLNSVNVSVSVMAAHLRDLKFDAIGRIGRLLGEAPSVAGDPKCRKIPDYLEHVSHHYAEQHATLTHEIGSLRKNIDHIKDIVQMQQSYSRLKATCEPVKTEELVDDALRLSGAELPHRQITIVREIEPLTVMVDKPKALQVLVNLLRNAIHACVETGLPDRSIKVNIGREGENQIRVEVMDNGVGIAAESADRLFTQGFTTRKDGHGYGLHSSALAAKAMAGTLTVASAGRGHGATFTLVIPLAGPPDA